MVPWSIEQPTGNWELHPKKCCHPIYLTIFCFFPGSELLSWLWCLIHLGMIGSCRIPRMWPTFLTWKVLRREPSKCVYVLNVGEPYIESIDTLIIDLLHKIDNDFDFLQKKSNDFQFFLAGFLKLKYPPWCFFNLTIDCDCFGWRWFLLFSRPKWTWFWSELTTTWRDFDWLSRKFDTFKSQCCLLLGWMMCSIYFSCNYMFCQ